MKRGFVLFGLLAVLVIAAGSWAAWPVDDLTTVHLDEPTDLPSLAREEILASVLKMKAVLAELPPGATVMSQDAGDTRYVNAGGDAMTGGLTINGGTVWHAGNDGAGSGLDADKIDGMEIYHGRVNGDGSQISLPAGWTSSRVSTGEYLITHNIGMNIYTVNVSVYGGTSNLVSNLGTTNPLTSFKVYVKTTAGSATDSAFHFILVRNY
jgi:hypothetical protein